VTSSTDVPTTITMPSRKPSGMTIDTAHTPHPVPPVTPRERLEPRPLPANIVSVQPGGGACYRLELAWGRWRRWWLRTFRRGYVHRMADCRTGDAAGAPHDVLDPRDLKYCRNLCTARWAPGDDPFAWRGHLRLARWGLAELVFMGTPLALAAAILSLTPAWWLAPAPAVVLGWLFWFFRDPARRVPGDTGAIVAPADGTVAEVVRVEHEPFLEGPAVRIGIFLSIFNVHINRAPEDCRAIELRYLPGKFLNALRPDSARENECVWIALEQAAAPYRRFVVRQIAGAIARRIVCQIRPGESLARGEKFGMIKLGSRTELLLPDEPGLVVAVTVGQRIQAGSTIVARYGGAAQHSSEA
jgi:phosphatidylserine decarboxylase